MKSQTKPRLTGYQAGQFKLKPCAIFTTNPPKIQLFGTFDQDTKNAVIITAREVSS